MLCAACPASPEQPANKVKEPSQSMPSDSTFPVGSWQRPWDLVSFLQPLACSPNPKPQKPCSTSRPKAAPAGRPASVG